MVVIKLRFSCGDVYRRLRDNIGWRISEAVLTVRSLTYNEHMSRNYAIDFMLEPIFWFVDNFAKYVGKVFVFCVTVLTAAVVGIAYWVGLPYWWERDPNITIFLVIIGNWLLLNIVFHYYMAVVTSPGLPPHGSTIIEAASICKKCISPKPPRTHHCSVCDCCVLKMDHHCPWLNNCVGFYNARYFYLYMVYMIAGVSFVMVAGIDVAYVAIWLNDTGGIIPHNDPELIGHPVRLNKSGVLVPVQVIAEYDSEYFFPREHILPVPPITEAHRITADPWKKQAVLFMAATCLVTFFALGVLAIMHGKNISRGETSVEAEINKTMKKIQGDSFMNPYDFGRIKNWKLFLGLVQGRTFIKHVLWPSRHKPVGAGISFNTRYNVLDEWP